jgi:plasmid stabilization system protein ParE
MALRQAIDGFVLTPRARSDLFEIWCYIAENNEEAANRVENAVFDACAFVAQNPLLGHTRNDLTTRNLRFWRLSRYPNYAVIYRPETIPLEIVSVLHGKGNISRILKQRQ